MVGFVVEMQYVMNGT